jgi:putative ABC transport system permease protein
MQERIPEGFTVWQLIWNSLRVRPVRTGVAILGIAIQVLLVLLIVGMTSGVVSDWAKRVEGVGADILVQPPHSSIFLALTTPVMQESLGDQIAQLRGVDQVAPVLVAADTRTLEVVYGIDYASFNALSATGFHFIAGHPFSGPDDAMVDDLKAQSKHLKLGDKITLLGHEFTVCGIVASGKGARCYMPLKTAQDLAGAERRVSIFYVRTTGDTEGTREALARLLPGHRILSMAEYLTLMNSSNLPELKPFVRSMVGLGLVIGFLVILLTMYTMVLERTREIGILKALGCTRLEILRLIVEETLLLGGLGTLAGLACTYALRAILKETNPTMTILISGGWVLRAVMLGLIAALVGALYPAYRAAQIDPVDALACE